MTTFSRVSFVCAVCGAGGEQDVLASTIDLGAPDLDLRPPPVRRFALEHELGECATCGYCAEDPAAPVDDDVRHLVRSEVYQRIAGDPLPVAANRFRRAAVLAEGRGEQWETAELLLRAAWACDDAQRWDAATELRREVVRRLEAELDGREPGEKTDVHRLRIVDLVRRAGDFEGAVARIDALVGRLPPGPPTQVARFQRVLAQRGDRADYGVDDALAPETEWGKSHALGERSFKWPGAREGRG